MPRSFIRSVRLFALILLGAAGASAQTEFLATVDPATGTVTSIDSVAGVQWITTGPNYTVFDEQNHRFIFRGGPDQSDWHLYSVSTADARIVTAPAFPVLTDSGDNVIELQYDNAAHKMYGLHWDNSEQREYFVSVDPATGAFAKLDSIAGVKRIYFGAGSTTFDKVNHRYYFYGIDDTGTSFLYCLDANTGGLLSKPVFPAVTDPADNVIELQYDNSTGTMYGLHWDNSEGREYFVTVNPAAGTFTKLDSLPGVRSIAGIPHYTCFNETAHRYLFRGVDSGGISRLYTVDASTGAILSKPVFPTFADPNDNVLELKYDNAANKLYALHWQAFTAHTTGVAGNVPVQEPFDLYPNPFRQSVTIRFRKSFNEIAISLYTSAGALAVRQVSRNASEMLIRRNDLASGTYLISVSLDGKPSGTRMVEIK